MENNLIPSAPEGDKHNDAHEQSAKETNTQIQQHVPTADGNKAAKSGLHYLAEIIAAGAIGTGVWVFGEHLTNHGHRTFGDFVNFLAFASFFAAAPITALKFWPYRKCVWGLFAFFVTLMAVVFILSSKPLKTDAPTVFPNRIHLATDKQLIRTAVTVANHGEFPVYDVVLRLAINRVGVPCSSLDIQSDNPPEAQTQFKDIPVNMFRYNAMCLSNTRPDIVYVKFGLIPANANRELRVAGTIRTNSWANLSVAGYDMNLALNEWHSNSFIWTIPPALWKDAKHGIKFPLTNFPYGAVLLTNGVPAFTNLPHVRLVLETPDFNGPSQFALTNDFLSIKYNPTNFSQVSGLLMAPTDMPTAAPMLKLWLVNDSGVDVTNIDVIFNSMVGFAFTTNDFWRENAASSNKTPTPLMWHWDSLPADRSIKIPPLSFADTSNGTGYGLIGICINAADMQQQLTGFWLTFIPSNALLKPFFSRVSTSCTFSSNSFVISMKYPIEFEIK